MKHNPKYFLWVWLRGLSYITISTDRANNKANNVASVWLKFLKLKRNPNQKLINSDWFWRKDCMKVSRRFAQTRDYVNFYTSFVETLFFCIYIFYFLTFLCDLCLRWPVLSPQSRPPDVSFQTIISNNFLLGKCHHTDHPSTPSLTWFAEMQCQHVWAEGIAGPNHRNIAR